MIDQLNLYNNLYNGINKLEKLYEYGFSKEKVIGDFCRSSVFLSENDKKKEYLELVSLETIILATLIGLNREKLEYANSKTDTRGLFQYKDYESSMKIFYDESNYEVGFEVSKEFCKQLNFNASGNGCFPYMLEIIKDNNKNRPYDYVSKIRNAMLHAEYYLETPEILHITNRDDNGNIIFEGRLLMYSFEMFVRDFFGLLGVSSSFSYFVHPIIEKFETKEDLVNYLFGFKHYKIIFTKIPSSYKFTGNDALYSRLNACFGLDSYEKTDIVQELDDLKKEGFEFDVIEEKLSKDQIMEIVKYIGSRYGFGNVFDNEEFVYRLSNLLKLIFCPISEITNCLENMLDYIALKKNVLLYGSMVKKGILDELQYDKYCNEAFLYTISLLKTNIMNYAIECSEFNDLDFSLFDTSKFNVDNNAELQRRKTDLILNGFSDNYANNRIVIETLRNALAHGGDRLETYLDNGLNIKLTDIYPNVPNLSVNFNINEINNLFNSSVLEPSNIKSVSGKKLNKSK